jgi:hypothetical protein
MIHTRFRSKILVALVPLMICSCSKQERVPESHVNARQSTFSSPVAAANALVEAAKSEDVDALQTVFGQDSKGIIPAESTADDKAALAGFVSDYEVMHRWRKLENGSELLITGADNKAFPLPLRRNDAGQWYFDVQAGKEEIQARRIGKNELAAIDVCAEIADAQKEYFGQRHGGASQYAPKFISDLGQQNGLYWESKEGSPRSPLGPLVVIATAEGYKVQPSQHQPFFGYYYAMLDKQGPDAKDGTKNYVVNGKMTGGFAIVAYPAHYGDSGIMTFTTNQSGVVLQKDLGKRTDEVAASMTVFNPDDSWKVVE